MAESSKSLKGAAVPESRRVGVGSSGNFPVVVFPPVGGVAGKSGSSLRKREQEIENLDAAKTVISKRSPTADDVLTRPSTTSEIGQRLVGCQLGHFRLDQFIGGGGMGAVFRAHDMRLGRSVAVKVLSRDQSDEESQLRFENEAQSSARLDHPNIARVFHVGDQDGWNYIVFEYVEGENIRDLVLREGPLSLDKATSITLQIAEALEHASGRDVVHRDIKPSNVLVCENGAVKLVDMGLARLHMVESSNPDLTASGVTLGTFDYISPEQARDPRGADVRSDLYSLGCTLYFMLAGQPPFPEGTVLQKLLSHSTTDIPDPRQVRPELPAEVAGIIARLMAKDPADRFQVPNELIGELLLMANRYGLPSGSQGGTVWVTPPETRLAVWERHLPWIAPVAILLLFAVASDWIWPSPESSGLPSAAVVVVPADIPPVEPLASPNHSQVGKSQVGKKPMPASLPGAESRSNNEEKPSLPLETPVASGNRSNETKPSLGPQVVSKQEPADESSRRTKDEVVSPAAKSSLPNEANRDITRHADTVPEGPSPDDLVDPVSAGLVKATSKTTSTPGGDVIERAPPPREYAVDMQAVRTLVVDPKGSTLQDPKVLVLPTFSEALRFLAVSPAAGEIELRFSGPQSVAPTEVAHRRLNIRAASGFTPEIVFQPKLGNPREFPRAMIRQLGGEVNWQGVHLRMELPSDAGQGWKFFDLVGIQSLGFMASTLTIANPSGMPAAEEGEAEEVSFFAIQPSSARAMALRAPDRPATPAPSINLWHTSVRGNAVLISMDEAAPLKFFWENGLLITSERLLRTGGARQEPIADDYIEMDLLHLTAICKRGLVMVASDASAPFLLPVNLESNHSILVTSAEAPLVEQRGAAIDRMRNSLLVSGRGNFYPQTEVFWRIVDNAATPHIEEMKFAEWSRHWPDEKLPQRLVEWTRDPAENARPLSNHVRNDYLMRSHPSNPAATSGENHSSAGFDAESLTDFPNSQAVVKRADAALSETPRSVGNSRGSESPAIAPSKALPEPPSND